MNLRDKCNLEFLLNSSPETIETWFLQADEDDIDYAMELLQHCKIELILKELDSLNSIEDVEEANQLLNGIFYGKTQNS